MPHNNGRVASSSVARLAPVPRVAHGQAGQGRACVEQGSGGTWVSSGCSNMQKLIRIIVGGKAELRSGIREKRHRWLSLCDRDNCWTTRSAKGKPPLAEWACHYLPAPESFFRILNALIAGP